MIEAIRENGLHAMSTASPDGIRIPVMTGIKLNTLITSIYYQLSKRLPPSQRINYEQSSRLLHCFLMSTFRFDHDPETGNHLVPVSSVKTALALLSCGKIEDKLTYVFSILSDPMSGHLMEDKFKSFVRDLCCLANGVNEEDDPHFSYDENKAARIVFFDHRIKLKELIEIIMNAKSPPICFSFFMAFSRMSDVEQVVHPISCTSCHRSGFTGFRYKCQKCFNFNLCQECFWFGRTAGSHDPNTHACREFSFWQSQSASIRRSFRCLPSQKAPKIQLREEPSIEPEKRIDLKHIVPPSPIAKHHMHNRIAPMSPFTRGSLAYGSLPNMGNNSPISRMGAAASPVHSGRNFNETASTGTNATAAASVTSGVRDEEHDLVAQYARKISNASASLCTPLVNRKAYLSAAAVAKSSSEMSEKQKMITQLEARNREVMRQIEMLKRGEVSPNGRGKVNGHNVGEEEMYATELTALRMRKEELEKHLIALQDSRKDLLVQLESLMKLLKNHGNLLTSSPTSAASTLNRDQFGSQNSGIMHSDSFRIRSDLTNAAAVNSSVTSPVRTNTTTAGSGSNRSAASAKAESVKNAMSSLVQELNSEDEAAIDELGLKLSKKLRTDSTTGSTSVPPSNAQSATSRLFPANKLPVTINNKKQSNVGTNRSPGTTAANRHKVDDDFDEDELVSNVFFLIGCINFYNCFSFF